MNDNGQGNPKRDDPSIQKVLTNRLRVLIAETTLTDPSEFADKILEDMTRDELVKFARRYLRNWAQYRLAYLRRESRRSDVSAWTPPTDRHSQPSDRGGRGFAGPKNSAQRRQQLTPEEKEKRRAAYMVSQRQSFNGTDWGIIGDFTSERCLSLSSEYRRHKAHFAAHERLWAALAAELSKHDVTFVRELPPALIIRFFSYGPTRRVA